MAHPSVDLVEEDAADLQFPKGNFSSKSTLLSCDFPPEALNFTKKRIWLCNFCSQDLCEPFIECVECREVFCPPCFASGRETIRHRNFHQYSVRQDDFPIFRGSSWTGREEKVLLDLIAKYGLGNWSDVAKGMRNRSSSECQRHYFQFYTNGLVGRMCGLQEEPYVRELREHWGKSECARLSRFPPETLEAKALAGYRAARGEFDIPYDQTAESILSHIDVDPWPSEEDTEASKELNCAVFRAFNHRLRERKRRYNVIREHGLLDHQSTAIRLQSIEEILSVGEKSFEKASNATRFSAFVQLLSAESLNLLVARLKHAQELRNYLQRLMEMRRLGVTSLYGGKLYYRLTEMRKRLLKSQKNQKEALDGELNVPVQGKKMNPIDIVGLPGYERLSEEEKHLCSTLRLEPNAFFTHRDTLLDTHAKQGHLALAEARKLLKIDVNKTRKLYDFLSVRGLISKPN
ncbi:transcriptional adapter 2A isoform X2 [Lutzomyia longipalpis]|nr:transcriptional adapter 2A isoform X2 [Lutzomyia longipalpis]